MTADFMTPPHSIEAEQSVLGGLLLDDDSSERTQKVLSILKPESFYARQHQVIFAEMRQMYRDHKPVDLLTSQLQRHRTCEAQFVALFLRARLSQ